MARSEPKWKAAPVMPPPPSTSPTLLTSTEPKREAVSVPVQGTYSLPVFTMRHASIKDANGVAELLQRCLEHDSRPALSEFKELRVPVANAVRTLVAPGDGGTISALAVAAWHAVDLGEDDGYWAAEVAIDPAHRTNTAYAEVLRLLTSDLGTTPAFWTFDAEQEAAARSLGLQEARAIVVMQRALPALGPEWPRGYTVRPFEFGDEGVWLALNQQVFSHHPEAGAIDSADLALRMAQPWFDPLGLLILEDDDGPAGYCWTKMHDDETGEIYMIGLTSAHRGKGLAKPLTRAGLAHLASRGADHAILYAEAANAAAVSLYQGMGFAVLRRIALYEGDLS